VGRPANPGWAGVVVADVGGVAERVVKIEDGYGEEVDMGEGNGPRGALRVERMGRGNESVHWEERWMQIVGGLRCRGWNPKDQLNRH
jgi:hypothetical protein